MGEGGSPRSGETGEGYLSARESAAVEFAETTPHPALHATFSHKGRRKKVRSYFLVLAFFAFFTGFSVGAFFSTFTATGVLAAIRIDRA
ncbi:hypothetical protein ACVWZV_008321 [Bradyrhizobium sp. GM5.1]